jgi:hypothetical protein
MRLVEVGSKLSPNYLKLGVEIMLSWQSCPKCKGKIYIDRDLYGWFVECLMCGYSRDLEELGIPQDRSVQVELTVSDNRISDILPESRTKYA